MEIGSEAWVNIEGCEMRGFIITGKTAKRIKLRHPYDDSERFYHPNNVRPT